MSGLVGLDRAEPLLEKAPVDRRGRASPGRGPVSTIWSSRARKRSFCRLSRRSLGRIESPPPSRRRDRITTKRPDQFARNQADRHRFLANTMTSRSPETPQKSARPDSSRTTNETAGALPLWNAIAAQSRFKEAVDQVARQAHLTRFVIPFDVRIPPGLPVGTKPAKPDRR